HARARPHQAVDDDRLLAGQPFADHPVAVDPGTRSHRDRRDETAWVDDIDDAAVQVGDDRLVPYHHPAAARRAGYVDPAEHAGLKDQVGIGEARAHPHRAGLAVEAVLREIEVAGEGRLLGIRHRDPYLQAAATLLQAAAAALAGVAGIDEEAVLVDVEV